MVRDAWIREFGFPVVIDETVEGLLPFGPFVEVGAGTGFLSRLLALRGADVVTTDAGTGTYGFRHGSWREVLIQDAVLEHPDRTVLMSWPSLGEPWCEEAASAIRPGGLLVHIGERGGCTGTDGFEAILEAGFEEIARVPMPVFCGIHDRVEVFRRKA